MRLLLLNLFFALSISNLYAAPQLDYDGDEIDDFVSVAINADGTLAWSVLNSQSGESTLLTSLGKNGDQIAPAIWRNGMISERVVISTTTSKTLKWNLEDISNFVFGAPGDLFITGGDFDNSGLSDAIVIEKKNGALLWRLKLDPFSTTPAGELEEPSVQFGSSSDRPFFANLDGDGDWFAVFAADSTSLRFLNPRTKEERSVSLDSALSLDDVPVPIQNEEGSDDLAFVEQLGPHNQVTIISTTGELLSKIKIRSNGSPIVGDFDILEDGGELGLANASGVVLFNPYSKQRSSVAFDKSILVDEINISSFAGSAADPGFDQCAVLNANDGFKTGFSWKPNSDTTYFAVAVMPGTLFRKVKKVEVYSLAGQFVKQLTYYGCGNPDSNGLRCNHKDFSITGKKYKKLYGSIALKVSMKDGTCGVYHIINPDKRTD